ncbi:carbohydrate sulfotransferase 6-like [Mauremys mutica]|nr:carbohydrate sulfotransferase 6-like [Mauremys mutica]
MEKVVQYEWYRGKHRGTSDAAHNQIENLFHLARARATKVPTSASSGEEEEETPDNAGGGMKVAEATDTALECDPWLRPWPWFRHLGRMFTRCSWRLLLLLSSTLLLLWLGCWHGAAPPPPGRTHILLLSSWRSGSTFAGQLFSQHPDVFYLMEPARHVWHHLPGGSPELLQGPARDLIRALFRCETAVLQDFMHQPHQVSQIFMWLMSRALCSPPACEAFRRGDIVSPGECQAHCNASPFGKAAEACITYSHVALKVVRFFQLEALYPLLADPALDLRIIHLVRDPRAVYASRQLISLYADDLLISQAHNATPNARLVMRKVCHSQAGIYLATLHHPPSALHGRYLLTRYEDLVRDPLGQVAEWYRYTGLASSPQLEAWVHNITHWSGPPDPEVTAVWRDASKVSQAWRHQLSFHQVQEVQEICKPAMEVFGYRPVSSEEEQRDLAKDLVLPREELETQTKGWSVFSDLH